MKWVEKPNDDGTKFVAFDTRSFPLDPPILIASSFEFPPKPSLNIGSAFQAGMTA